MMCLKSLLESDRVVKNATGSRVFKVTSLQYEYMCQLGLLDDNISSEDAENLFDTNDEEIRPEYELSFREHLLLNYNMMKDYSKLNGKEFIISVDGNPVNVTIQCSDIKFNINYDGVVNHLVSDIRFVKLHTEMKFLLEPLATEDEENVCVDMDIHKLCTKLSEELKSLHAFCRLDSTLFKFSPLQVCLELDNNLTTPPTDDSEDNESGSSDSDASEEAPTQEAEN